jgi:hypothetical protein
MPKFVIEDGIQKCTRCGNNDHYKNGVVADFSDDEEEWMKNTCKDCSNKVSKIGWDKGDAPREYCEECYIKDQEWEDEEDEEDQEWYETLMAKKYFEEEEDED